MTVLKAKVSLLLLCYLKGRVDCRCNQYNIPFLSEVALTSTQNIATITLKLFVGEILANDI